MINPVLFINDATEVFLPIVRDGVDVDSATVSFGVWTAKTGGTQVGTDVSMTWDGVTSTYRGIFTAAVAAGLTETGIGGPFYWVRIVATGYTARRIQCRAAYRGQE